MFPSSGCRAIQKMRLLPLRTERGCEAMRSPEQILAVPGATFVLLLVAATMEVLGDAFFQSAVHRSSGLWRWIFLVAGGGTLSLYGFPPLVFRLTGTIFFYPTTIRGKRR